MTSDWFFHTQIRHHRPEDDLIGRDHRLLETRFPGRDVTHCWKVATGDHQGFDFGESTRSNAFTAWLSSRAPIA